MPKLYVMLQSLNEDESIKQIELFAKYTKHSYLSKTNEERCVADGLQQNLDQLMKAYLVDDHEKIRDAIKRNYIDIIEVCL